MKNELLEALKKAASAAGVEVSSASAVNIDFPESLEHGDFTTNVAMVNAKKLSISPRALAEKIVAEFEKTKPASVEAVNIAGPGFINFKIKDEVFAKEVLNPAKAAKATKDARKKPAKILIEHTDPNTFKPFHIGHLMANAIGESLSRLVSFSGADVTRICYPSDIGLHIAKSIWAIKKCERGASAATDIPADTAPVIERTAFLGKMYAEGTATYEADPQAKKEIDALNVAIYEKSDKAANIWYEKGRKWSLEHFELLYKRLGTQFDEYIYESEVAPIGKSIVEKFLDKGIFEKSEGAVVFPGEKYGLHTRVFISAIGLPTYEAKDIGLNVTKFQKHPEAEKSIIITANEQNDYFRVLIKALSCIDENVGAKTKHIGHGMLRLPSGKMSSRTGKVITAETLIDDIKALVVQKIADRKFTPAEADEVADMVAIAAIKYTILRQAIGGDVIFDSAASISFEGDSGPYLQYAAVRAGAILQKAADEGIGTANAVGAADGKNVATKLPEKVGDLEKLITRFSVVAERACTEYAPQHIAGYLISLASTFNSFYASQMIVDKKNPLSPYYVAVTKAFRQTMIDGLDLLGIKVPKRM